MKNKIIKHGRYYRIELRNIKRKITGYAIIDIKSLDLIKDKTWHLAKDGYVRSKNSTLLHRTIMKAPKETIIDHINRNKLDNRLRNLRFATYSINCRNSKVRNDNKLGIRGVCLFKQYNKYVSYYGKSGKLIFLGYHTNLKNAIKARKNYERSLQ